VLRRALSKSSTNSHHFLDWDCFLALLPFLFYLLIVEASPNLLSNCASSWLTHCFHHGCRQPLEMLPSFIILYIAIVSNLYHGQTILTFFFSFLNFDSSCSPCATINLCLSKSPWSLQKKFLAPLKIVHNPIAFKFETTSHLHNTYTKPLLFSRKNGVPLYANCLQEIFWLRFWSLLQREDLRGNIHSANKALEVVAMYIFPNNKWRNNNIFFFCILCFVYTFTFHSWSIELRMIDVTT